MSEYASGSDAVAEFEFAALAQARNYRRALIKEFAPHIHGRVLEIGAGIGQITSELIRCPSITELVSVEPDARFCAVLREQFPKLAVVHGTIQDIPIGDGFDCIVSVNVLEHIEDDSTELRHWRQHLLARRGTLCLFVPARAELFSPIDARFGHYRRYSRAVLGRKLESAGFRVHRIRYYNFAGYWGWLINFRLLRSRHFDANAIRVFDRFIFPVVNWIEVRVCAPPIGQNLLAIARAV